MGIPPETSQRALKTLFEDAKILALCQRIVDGFDTFWNDSNFVGKYNADAMKAIGEVESIIDSQLWAGKELYDY